ncbi:hypothetical protein ZWY2020_048023 [Hordeum vulgare]|nr:hypothetical protein ZWY2020_048023 [Hordeum vulgare]
MGATIPARIQPGYIDHVPCPTVISSLGRLSLALLSSRRAFRIIIYRLSFPPIDQLGKPKPSSKKNYAMPRYPYIAKELLVIPRLQDARR